MKKPEPPKSRLIREDVLPEPDPIENYRIKKVTQGDGKVWYYPQKKILWFWWNIGVIDAYICESRAQARIFEDYHKTLKDKVEYLAPDSSKITSPTPNSPPKNP